MSGFILSYMQMKIFGAIIILLNITHVCNISFCSSMFIKKVQYKTIELGRYYQNIIIPVCPTQPPYNGTVQKNVHLATKQYSACKSGHLKFCICIKLVIHLLSFHLINLISPFESQFLFANLCSFFNLFLSKSSGCLGNLLIYSLALQPSDSLGPLTSLITD